MSTIPFKTAEQLAQEAQEAARLANLKLEHPHVAERRHAMAAEAYLALGELGKFQEHKLAEEHWRDQVPIGEWMMRQKAIRTGRTRQG